jgi:GMP reductase
MKIEDDVKLDFADVLIRPKRSELKSRKDVSLYRHFDFKIHGMSITWNGVPIAAANMSGVGTFEVAEKLSTHRMLTCIHKFYSEDKWIENYNKQLVSNPDIDCLVYSMGMGSNSYEEIRKATNVIENCPSVKFICIDVANGYTQKFIEYVSTVRRIFPGKVLIAGNVVTREMTEALILAGANIVKVGIGPGSVCTTRKVAGVGYPQLSAIIECADAAHGLGGHIMADGGCTCPGDVAKAFGAGGDFVMLGGMFAGSDEAAEHDDCGTRVFYGMSSDTAMNKFVGGVATYRASEGKTIKVKETGPIDNTVQDILGGVRSACTYVGATRLKDLSKCTTFVRVNRQINSVFNGQEIA